MQRPLLFTYDIYFTNLHYIKLKHARTMVASKISSVSSYISFNDWSEDGPFQELNDWCFSLQEENANPLRENNQNAVEIH